MTVSTDYNTIIKFQNWNESPIIDDKSLTFLTYRCDNSLKRLVVLM